MEPLRPKKLVIATWIIAALTTIVVAPITFIIGVFASDNSTGAGSPISYALIAFPLIYPVLAIAMQVAYSRASYGGSRVLAYVLLGACGASLALLVALFTGVL